jgi:hypothetical protein
LSKPLRWGSNMMLEMKVYKTKEGGCGSAVFQTRRR